MLLGPGDAFYFHAETPTTTSRWAMALEVDTSGAAGHTTVDELRAHVADRLDRIPWAAWRVHVPRHGVGRHRWLDAGPLPLDRMVVAERSPHRSVDPLLAQIAMEELDPALPLWRLRLVELADARQFVVLEAHHAFAGGFVAAELLRRFFGPTAPGASDRPPSPPRRVDALRQAGDAVWWAAARARAAAGRLRPAPPWDPAFAGEPLVGPVGAARVNHVERLPFDRVRTLGEAYGAGTTRTLVALLARALDDLAPHASRLRALFPRGTQEGPVTMPGNASRGSFLELPLHRAPADRLDAVLTSIAADEPAVRGVADLTLSFQPELPHLALGPRPLVSIETTGPLRLCARPVTRLTVIVQHYRDGLFVTFTADRDALAGEVPALGARLQAAAGEFERDVAHVG